MLSHSEIVDRSEVSMFDAAEHKRMSVLFHALRYGIKYLVTKERNNEKAYDHCYDKLLSKSYHSLKMLIFRKRKIRQRASRLRKIHY
jgi:hypothetical protein